MHIYSCSCVFIVGAVWNDTKGCCCGRPPLEGISLQGERIIIDLEAASTLCQTVAQQTYKSIPFVNSWEQILGNSSWLYMTVVYNLSMADLSLIFESALRDRCFPPIQAREIPYLECTVSILIDYEPAANYLDWEVGKHGMIMEFSDPDNTRCSATCLPEVAARKGWTKTQTIDSLMRKSGYMGSITEFLRKRVRITRY